MTDLSSQTMTTRNKTFWTIGNLLMLVGLFLLLLVGGLLADERYNVLAAQGDSPIASLDDVLPTPLPVVAGATTPQPLSPTAAASSAAAQTQEVVFDHNEIVAARRAAGRWLPQINDPGKGVELNLLPPQQQAEFGPNEITRIQIPVIDVDKKVVPVGLKIIEQNGADIAIWDVAKYKVGHHESTSNPGQGGNIVLAGHSGGDAYPFNQLRWLEPDAKIVLWTGDRQWSYTVTQTLVLDELGPTVTEAERRSNAQYIEPTGSEMVTIVTCWPLSDTKVGNRVIKKFTQRVIVRAVPDRQVADATTPTPVLTNVSTATTAPTGTAAPTDTTAPTATTPPTPTDTSVPTATTAPTATVPAVAACIPLANTVRVTDQAGNVKDGRFGALNTMYLANASEAQRLVGTTLYVRVTTPNGATALTTVGTIRVTQPTFAFRLLDYVQVINQNDPGSAYKLVISTRPDFGTAVCTLSTNFRIATPTATATVAATPSATNTTAGTATTAPTKTTAPTATTAPAPTKMIAPTATAPAVAAGCIPLATTVRVTDQSGTTTDQRFPTLDAVYLANATEAQRLVGRALYVHVVTPNGATALTTVGTIRVTQATFSFRLLDYVQVINQNDPGSAYKLILSTEPDFATGACTLSTNFRIAPAKPFSFGKDAATPTPGR